jgi:hypothetical protein
MTLKVEQGKVVRLAVVTEVQTSFVLLFLPNVFTEIRHSGWTGGSGEKRKKRRSPKAPPLFS